MKMSELYETGAPNRIGSYVFTSEKIIRYATRFDPQVFHMDAELARNTLFGGLCASGWHTCAAWMRTFLGYWERETTRLKAEGIEPPTLGPSPGFSKLAWLKPVFSGDTVSYSVTLLASRELASRPGWILNTILCEGRNQNDEPVIRFESGVLEFS